MNDNTYEPIAFEGYAPALSVVGKGPDNHTGFGYDSNCKMGKPSECFDDPITTVKQPGELETRMEQIQTRGLDAPSAGSDLGANYI
ncbi:hypothetical protein JXC34_03995 [Candidatus Woesearchaeota archaeon]|nr:hypothetical protein [Candidatus Woesearchaeota archaeon]